MSSDPTPDTYLATRLRELLPDESEWEGFALIEQAADRIDQDAVEIAVLEAEVEQLRAVVDHPIIKACIGMNALQFPEVVPR